MEARQLPYKDGRARPLTLIAELRRALFSSRGCEMVEDHQHMCYLLHDDRFKTLIEENAESIVWGEKIDVCENTA